MLVQKWLRAMADGLSLRCPSCRQGRMQRTFFELHSHCPACGINFQPNPGDFLGTITVAYGVLAVLVVVGMLIVHPLLDLSTTAFISLWTIFVVLVVFFFFRNLKGLWIGILYAMTDLKRLQ